MIEVIKHGKPDGRIRWTAVCSKCGCEFTHDNSDVRNFYGMAIIVVCPDCGRNVPVGNSMEVRG